MCVLIWNVDIARLDPMSNVYFSIEMQILQGWIPCLVCVSVLECKCCKVGSQIQSMFKVGMWAL
jgi:hypothetical protein